MFKRVSAVACVFSYASLLVACSNDPGPIVLQPVDKDIDGVVIVRADEREDESASRSGGAEVGGALFHSDDGPVTPAVVAEDLPSRASMSSGASVGGSGGLFSDESDLDAATAMTSRLAGDSSALSVDKAAEADRFFGSGRSDERSKVKPVERLETEGERFDPEISAGILTAGALNDWPDTSAYQAFITKLVKAYEDVAAFEAFTQGHTFELNVLSREGEPLANAEVLVQEQFGESSIALRTRTDGRAIVSTGWDGLETDEDLLVTVNPMRGLNYTVTVDPANPLTHQVRLPHAPNSRSVNRVQIALVLDCTGSMGDELAYLKVELKSIAEAVADAYPGLEQEYALVAYRDSEDAYVTRTIDFTPGISEFIAELGKQGPDGGGDTPEAVQRAYAEAADLSWAEGRVARIALHVADAPPHLEDQAIAMRQVDRLREQGVALYPVASSGSSIETQFTMRTAALLTGAQYLFLTDDSGVGNEHAEPAETKGYAVMPLRSHMLRVIASEIEGRPIEVDPTMVIREVGAGE